MMFLGAFQQFFRENSEAWLERPNHKEAEPPLLMLAFLQRVVNLAVTIAEGAGSACLYGCCSMRGETLAVLALCQGIEIGQYSRMPAWPAVVQEIALAGGGV